MEKATIFEYMSLRRKGLELAKKIAGTHFTDTSDEFINWLLVSNAGMQHRGNVACFEHAIKNLPNDSPVLEIGAHAGQSANIICYLLRKFGKSNQVISVDPWIVRGYKDEQTSDATYLENLAGDPEVNRVDFADFIKDSYLRNTEFFSKSNLPYVFRNTSDEFFALLKSSDRIADLRNRELKTDLRFSLVYIDGNHDYDFAKRDFENAHERLAEGGFILFDDSEDHSNFGCAQLAREIESHPDYTLVMKNPNRLFQKNKIKK